MLCSLFASSPVIAAEPEAVPVAEIFNFKNRSACSVFKQYGVGPVLTYSSDWWGIVEEGQRISPTKGEE